MHTPSNYHKGFTIVELLIVIVVIGILATITIVAYNGVQQKAIGASLLSDLNGAADELKIYQVYNGSFPTSNDCAVAAPAPPKICLKSSPGNSYVYSANNLATPQTFALAASHGNLAYSVTDTTTPVLVVASLPCPTGFIQVPGSPTYGTADFCTMKYAAKNVGGVATSQAASAPWGNLTATATLPIAAAACSGCHVMTEPEWMTIVQNVLGIASNWSGGSVGSGFIYSGHNDGSPSNTLDADSNDANGYYGTGNSSPSNQRRTLTLSNGAVIWDLAGNSKTRTSGTSTTGQPGITGECDCAYWPPKEWPSVNVPGSLPTNPFPAGTGISGASTWNSSNGIGELVSFSRETALHGFFRGGSFTDGSAAGVLALSIDNVPDVWGPSIGFRVSR